VSTASKAASTVVSVVEPSSWNWVEAAAPADFPPDLEGDVEIFAEPGFMMVVAGFATGLAVGLAAPAATAAPTAAPAAAAAAIGTAPAAGFAVGRFSPGRAAPAGRFGLTVMRAVSFGGALLTTAVPDLLFGSVTPEAGEVTTGFSGPAPGAGGVTTVVAAAGWAANVVGRTGLTGATGAIGATGAAPTGLMGLTGSTAAGAGLTPGGTGATGATGLMGETPPAVGMTGGGGTGLGAPVGVGLGGVSIACVRRGGATVAPAGVTGDSGLGATDAGG